MCPSSCRLLHKTGEDLALATCPCGLGYFDKSGIFVSGDRVRTGKAVSREAEAALEVPCDTCAPHVATKARDTIARDPLSNDNMGSGFMNYFLAKESVHINAFEAYITEDHPASSVKPATLRGRPGYLIYARQRPTDKFISQIKRIPSEKKKAQTGGKSSLRHQKSPPRDTSLESKDRHPSGQKSIEQYPRTDPRYLGHRNPRGIEENPYGTARDRSNQPPGGRVYPPGGNIDPSYQSSGGREPPYGGTLDLLYPPAPTSSPSYLPPGGKGHPYASTTDPPNPPPGGRGDSYAGTSGPPHQPYGATSKPPNQLPPPSDPSYPLPGIRESPRGGISNPPYSPSQGGGYPFGDIAENPYRRNDYVPDRSPASPSTSIGQDTRGREPVSIRGSFDRGAPPEDSRYSERYSQAQFSPERSSGMTSGDRRSSTTGESFLTERQSQNAPIAGVEDLRSRRSQQTHPSQEPESPKGQVQVAKQGRRSGQSYHTSMTGQSIATRLKTDRPPDPRPGSISQAPQSHRAKPQESRSEHRERDQGSNRSHRGGPDDYFDPDSMPRRARPDSSERPRRRPSGYATEKPENDEEDRIDTSKRSPPPG